MAKLFWVEDQSHWIERFSAVLEQADFDGEPNHLEIHKFPQAAQQRIARMSDQHKPDLALLDAHMNGSERAGFSVSRALQKKWPDLPILYLSEHSGTDIEQQAITELDAQDFIAKHQRNIEAVLVWRIKAQLNKRHHQRLNKLSARGSALLSGNLELNTDTWEVFWKGAKLMNPHNPKRPLAPTPRKILRFLVERSPRPLSTEQIADLLGADLERFSYANYRQHIKTLRSAFAAAENQSGDFNELCQQGKGIVTFGDAHAYFWKSDL